MTWSWLNKIKRLLENKRYQSLYLFLLILLVPAVIIFNTSAIIGDFQDTLTIELQRKALLSSNIIDVSTDFDVDNRSQIQSQIEEIAFVSEEFEAVDILIPSGSGFEVAASLEPEAIGQKANQAQYSLAWQQSEAIAHVTNTDSKVSVELLEIPAYKTDKQFWVVTKALRNQETGEPFALLSIKVNSSVITRLVRSILVKSYLLLALTVALTLAIIAGISQIFKSQGEYRKKVQQLADVKTNFITVVSHVMRTPLNSVRWNLEMMLGDSVGKLSDEQKEFLRLMYKSNQNMLQMVQDLIVALDIEQQTLTVNKEDVFVDKLVDSVLIELQPSINAAQHDVKVLKPSTIPKIKADPKLLEQAIYKLVDNAIKYTKEQGKIRIQIIVKKRNIWVVIKDNGVGIPDDEKSKLFVKFYRGRLGLKIFPDAAGLGLFVANNIIKRHGGELGFRSKEGVGSSFYISVPFA